nr:hypothetical protein [Saccharopolyspora gloriosae]
MSPSGKARAADVCNDRLSAVDPEVAGAVGAELGRQRDTLEMFSSENFAPLAA